MDQSNQSNSIVGLDIEVLIIKQKFILWIVTLWPLLLIAWIPLFVTWNPQDIEIWVFIFLAAYLFFSPLLIIHLVLWYLSIRYFRSNLLKWFTFAITSNIFLIIVLIFLFLFNQKAFGVYEFLWFILIIFLLCRYLFDLFYLKSQHKDASIQS